MSQVQQRHSRKENRQCPLDWDPASRRGRWLSPGSVQVLKEAKNSVLIYRCLENRRNMWPESSMI